MFSKKLVPLFTLFLLGLLAPLSWLGFGQNLAAAQNAEPQFTTDFGLERCNLLMPFSTNPYFVLNPGYQLTLTGQEDGEEIRVVITALKDTETIDLTSQGIGPVRARVIEEREWVAGELVEVSRNFFAQCLDTGAVYYFGETVDNYEAGVLVNHNGAWRAGEGEARPGLMMPGVYLLGSRYFQEIAPDVAMDRAENVAMGQDITTPAGTFSNCITMLETSPLEPGSESIKTYCYGIGLVIDDQISLVDANMAIPGNTNDDDDAGEVDEAGEDEVDDANEAGDDNDD